MIIGSTYTNRLDFRSYRDTAGIADSAVIESIPHNFDMSSEGIETYDCAPVTSAVTTWYSRRVVEVLGLEVEV